MKERLTQLLERVRQFWGSLLRWQRISLVAAAVLVLGGLTAVVLIAGRTSYEPIFSGLEPRDQQSVISYLTDEKIPYRTDSQANAILVPTANVYEARIALAARGIPTGGIVGFERFDQAAMGRTSFQEKVDYYRALEGELSRTIREMRSVESARVSIVVPETKLFLEQQQPSTAAVLLKLRGGAAFDQDQARAVIHLVASSVEGLTPENVTLVDADGNIPFDDILDDALTVAGGTNKIVLKHRQFERDDERELERKIRETLEKVFGPGKVKAAVRVELDFNRKQSRQRTVSPLEGRIHGTVQSTQNTEESYSGPAGIAGGPPGTTTNIPGYPVNTGQYSGPAQYDRTDSVTNYDNSTHEVEEIESQGKIKRMTATVLIDANLEQEQLDQWRGAVSTAIGLDVARGDQLSIVSMPFDTTLADQYAARLEAERRRKLIIALSTLLILLIVIAVLVVMYIRKRRRLAAMAASVLREEGAPSLKELLENPDLMTSQGELAVLEEQMRNYAMNNPEEFANLIKNWVVDEG